MSDILNKNYTLVLNAVWQPIGYTYLKKAINSMFSTEDGESMATQALDLEYEFNEEGFIDFLKPSKMMPVGISEWINLPVRDFDIPIHTSKSVIRAPIILITKNFSKMPFRKLRPTKRNLYDTYKGKCIWTGRTLSFNEASIEHMNPKSHGGNDGWKNVAIADKRINTERGNIPLDKWKYKPQYHLFEPKATPVSCLISEPKRPEWEYFLFK